MSRALSTRLVVAAAVVAVTLASALGAFVVLPVNALADRQAEQSARVQARLAADLLRAGGTPIGVTVCAARSACRRDGYASTAADTAARSASYARSRHDDQTGFAVAAVGDGRLVLATVDRGGAIERRERLGLLLALAVVLAGAMGSALWAGAAYTRRLGRIARVARRIADGDLSARAGIEGRDELATLGADVDRMALKLGALERARGEFVAKISHDLRTPLTVIKGYAFTLGRRARGTEERRRLDAIGREADRLGALVDDLLTLAQAGAGELRIARGPLVAEQLIEEVVERVRPLAAEHDVAIIAGYAPGVEVYGDERRLAQVLTNLATNAIKHTPPGGVVRLDAVENGDGIALCVEDTGCGIDPARVERLLLPFESGDSPAAGAGLGLAIVQELVAAHGGRLAFEPRAGGGTVARVSLPAAARVAPRLVAVP